MATVVILFWILKVLATGLSLWFSGKKVHRWIRRKVYNKRKPTV